MTFQELCAQPLALKGGPKTVTQSYPALFRWPIVTPADEEAVLGVLRAGAMSGTDISQKFEAEWAAYNGTQHALSYCNGTAALLGAMFGVGVGRGDEIICPSITYWASAMPAFNLGATVVFADLEESTLCIDPADIERHISPRTRAIVVVHYCGHPCDMDPIMSLARKHVISVIEDVSHAHGSLYKGRMCGTIGDVGAMSMMSGKSFPIGEGGMLVTDNREIYERAMSFSHYERITAGVTSPALKACQTGVDRHLGPLPLGGIKGRMNQTCSAMGRVQLQSYPERVRAIQAGMNRFWDLLEGTPGLRPHRPAGPRFPNSTMGGWYNPLGLYRPEELGGLPIDPFIKAVQAEGGIIGRGANSALHLHKVMNEADIYHDGKPTRLAFAARDVRQPPAALPVSTNLAGRVYGIPWFKHDDPEAITRYAAALRKVALHAKELLAEEAVAAK